MDGIALSAVISVATSSTKQRSISSSRSENLTFFCGRHDLITYLRIVIFCNLNTESFLLCWSSLLLGLLGSLVLSFLGVLLFLVDSLLVSLLFGNLVFLSFLDFSNGFFSKGFFVFGFGILKLVDSIQSDTLNGSLLFSFVISLSLSLASFGLLNFLMQSSPGSCPSQSLSFDFPSLDAKYLSPKFLFRFDKKRKGLPSLATNLTPLPG